MSRWSQGGGDKRRVTDLSKPWPKREPPPPVDTSGVPEWVLTGYQGDDLGMRIAVARFREPKIDSRDLEMLARYKAAPKKPTFRCVGPSCKGIGVFAEPNTTCFSCRRGR